MLLNKIIKYLKSLEKDYFHNRFTKNVLDRFLYFQFLCSQIPTGDIVECGIGKTRTFQMLIYLNQGKNIIGFDSFSGFPDVSVFDNSFRNPEKGQWNIMTNKKAIDTIKCMQIDLSKVKIIEGYFEDTLKQYEGEIAFLHLDCDLYNSYKVCLEKLFSKVKKGGIVAFDEYNEPKFPGATKAIDEFLNKKYNIQKYNCGNKIKHFIVK